MDPHSGTVLVFSVRRVFFLVLGTFDRVRLGCFNLFETHRFVLHGLSCASATLPINFLYAPGPSLWAYLFVDPQVVAKAQKSKNDADLLSILSISFYRSGHGMSRVFWRPSVEWPSVATVSCRVCVVYVRGAGYLCRASRGGQKRLMEILSTSGGVSLIIFHVTWCWFLEEWHSQVCERSLLSAPLVVRVLSLSPQADVPLRICIISQRFLFLPLPSRCFSTVASFYALGALSLHWSCASGCHSLITCSHGPGRDEAFKLRLML